MRYIMTVLLCGLVACSGQQDRLPSMQPPMAVRPDTSHYVISIPAYDSLYNKVLGSLVGSAIGDAMGAPTEMWKREDRVNTYGYIEELDPSFIDPSPEGLWDFYLPSGSTTDDTRWKYLVGKYVAANLHSFYEVDGPDPYLFSRHIVSAYQDEIVRLKETPGYNPQDFEGNIRRLTWLQEWAEVAEPFAHGDLETYTRALHGFYGGELLCAGMLYAPALALPYPGNPEKAYHSAYRLGIFDQGYARDITGLTAAMVAAALSYQASKESILEVFQKIDPHNYFRSRLLGRVAFRTFQDAQRISQYAKKLTSCHQQELFLPLIANDSLKTCQLQLAYTQLDQRNQDAPAHAQEILMVTITAILFSDFDFQQCMEFIANYGRDNDTSGAVAGAVLGAFHGFNDLPLTLREQVIKANRYNLSIDLEALAHEITESIISAHNP